jgi:hypothetical protein
MVYKKYDKDSECKKLCMVVQQFQELNEAFLKNPVLIGIVSTSIGTFIGSLISVLNTWINARSQESREKQQRIREDIQKQHVECISQLAWFKIKLDFNDYVELRIKLEKLTIVIDVLSIYYLKQGNIFQKLRRENVYQKIKNTANELTLIIDSLNEVNNEVTNEVNEIKNSKLKKSGRASDLARITKAIQEGITPAVTGESKPLEELILESQELDLEFQKLNLEIENAIEKKRNLFKDIKKMTENLTNEIIKIASSDSRLH